MKITILSVGKDRKSTFRDLYNFYAERIKWDIQLIEVESRKKNNWKQQRLDETNKLFTLTTNNSAVISLDEKGKLLSSRELSAWISAKNDQGVADISFLIGGPYGLDSSVLENSHLVLALGRVTWPHLMIRGMLAEQIYRAQQILDGHPYHKD